MAVWNVGPFDNDDAVDWFSALEATDRSQRVDFVKRTLDGPQAGETALTFERAAEVVAAAAMVLGAIRRSETTGSSYPPPIEFDELERQAVTALSEVAVAALTALMSSGSVWRQGWAESVEAEEALEAISLLRAQLMAVSR